jgi:hypothetical protein
MQKILGAFNGCTREVLTIHVEALTRIMFHKQTNGWPNPRTFTQAVLRSINIKEKNVGFKNKIEALIND